MPAAEPPTQVLIAPEQQPVPVIAVQAPAQEGTPAGTSPLQGAPAQVTTTTVSAPVPAMPPTVTKLEGVTLPPTTTEEQDIVTKGQRRVSLLWESVQGFISVAITLAVIYCQIRGITSETLNNAFFFVVATYLQRTNHVRIGGVGLKPYEGR